MRTVHCAMSLIWLRATCQGTIVLAFSSVYVVLLVVCSALDIRSVCSPCVFQGALPVLPGYKAPELYGSRVWLRL